MSDNMFDDIGHEYDIPRDEILNWDVINLKSDFHSHIILGENDLEAMRRIQHQLDVGESNMDYSDIEQYKVKLAERIIDVSAVLNMLYLARGMQELLDTSKPITEPCKNRLKERGVL